MSDNQSYDLGNEFIGNHHYALLEYVLAHHVGDGVALEFGVGGGTSTRLIAGYMPVIGFDSFEGLPEDWREGYPKGSFKHDPPEIDNVKLVVGMFKDIPDTVYPRRVGLVHIDCDLYSSTATALEWASWFIIPGCCIVFDEWHGYEGCEQYEQRAWREFVEATGIAWRVLGHGHEQWAVKIV